MNPLAFFFLHWCLLVKHYQDTDKEYYCQCSYSVQETGGCCVHLPMQWYLITCLVVLFMTILCSGCNSNTLNFWGRWNITHTQSTATTKKQVFLTFYPANSDIVNIAVCNWRKAQFCYKTHNQPNQTKIETKNQN